MGVVFFNRPELITYNDVCMFLILSQKGLKNLAKRGYTQPLWIRLFVLFLLLLLDFYIKQ